MVVLGILTHLLIDYQGYIVAFQTNIHGRNHDAVIGTYNKLFKRILGKKFALTDPGFEGNSNVVAGIKSPRTKGEKLFDQISRKEQVAVEHVNAWVKNAKVLDKNTNFRSSPDKLVLSVFIVCGMHNWKLDLR